MPAQAYNLTSANSQQIVTPQGIVEGSSAVYLLFTTPPSAGTVTLEYRRIGTNTFRPLVKAAAVTITSGELAARIDGNIAAIRVTFAGLVGGASPTLWVVPNTAPIGLYTGLAAMIAQSYNEANVKNGNQFEAASNTAALIAGPTGNIDIIFTTGALPVIIKGRIVKFNGTSLNTRVYRGPTFTGGVITPYFNLNDRNPATGLATIRTGAVVTVPGTEFGAPTFDIGTEGQGNTSVSTYSVVGNERLLAPNTVYLQRINNDSAATQRVASYLTWYEGDTDLPL